MASRLAVFPYLYYLYSKNYFEKKLSLAKREIPLLIGCMAFFAAADYLGNEIMWSNNERIIRKYKTYSDVKQYKMPASPQDP